MLQFMGSQRVGHDRATDLICVLIMVLTTKLMSQSDHLFSSTIYKRYSKGWHEAEVVTSSSILGHKSQIAMRSQTGPAALGAEGWRG